MSKKETIQYSGEEATVSWNGKLCIHVGECGRAKGDLFIGGRKPWCDPNLAPNDEVSDVILRCPTGALSVDFADGSRVEKAPGENTVQVAYNGPLFVRGDLDIEGAPADVPGLKFRAALCRCGQSKNKPYCDNSHEDAGFKDYGAIGDTGAEVPGSGGKLQVKLAPDGPLLVRGNMSMTASSGRVAWHGKQAALCRCGASNNKPFCDGQHKKVGFKST
ncbi:MAG: CDGSH iron-sulfur domain-containing protein [Woeseiaceae bacterium]